MKHFFLQDRLFSGENEITFINEDFHYLKHVLRLRPGSTLTGIDTQGCLYDLKILHEDREKLIATYSQKQAAGKEDSGITLCQGLLKGTKFDTVIRQATEAGVDRIIPLISEFTVVRIREEAGEKKNERWRKIAREAVQQCGRLSIPRIDDPVAITKLKELPGLKLFFHQENISGNSLHRQLAASPEKINILVGPEGGFSEKEIDWLKKADFSPVFLGKNVLRAETAALFAIAAVKTILLEKNEWRIP